MAVGAHLIDSAGTFGSFVIMTVGDDFIKIVFKQPNVLILTCVSLLSPALCRSAAA